METLSLKKIIKDSLAFYGKHWRVILLFFLPAEFLILIFTLLGKFILPVYSAYSIVPVVSSLSLLLAVLLAIFKKIIYFSSGVMVNDLKSVSRSIKIFKIYKEIFKKIIPVIWVCILSGLILFLVFGLSFFFSSLVFILPFSGIGFLGKYFPFLLYFMFSHSLLFFFTFLSLAILFFIFVNAFFLAHFWFAPYVLFLEGRGGFNSLASSALLLKGRRWKIFWRMFLVWLVAFVPFTILVLPTYVGMLPDFLRHVSFSVMFGLPIQLPPIAGAVAILNSVKFTLASAISFPILSVMSFMFWEHLKNSAIPFEQKSYFKTLKRIQAGAVTGLIALISLIVWQAFFR